MDDSTRKRRPSVKQLSKTPSWIMLGFVLGAAVVLALPKRREPAVPRPIVIAPAEDAPRRQAEPARLTTIEAVFSEWHEFAVWEDDVTQVAMWNSAEGEFSDYYEIRRYGDRLYFRSIPHLTNRLIRHGKMPPPECPLRFTETERQYQEWREHGRFERPPEVTRPSVGATRAPLPTPSPSIDTRRVEPPPSEKPAGSPAP